MPYKHKRRRRSFFKKIIRDVRKNYLAYLFSITCCLILAVAFIFFTNGNPSLKKFFNYKDAKTIAENNKEKIREIEFKYNKRDARGGIEKGKVKIKIDERTDDITAFTESDGITRECRGNINKEINCGVE